MEKNLRGSDVSADTDQAAVRGSTADTVTLAAEQLSVDRREIETGRVRIATVTREHEELVDVPLTRESVEVTRVPVGRAIETMPPVRQDGDTTIVSVVEEIVVVERRLILKEELHIKRVRTVERHQERVTLRHQEAVVTRSQAGVPDADAVPGSGTEI